MSTFEEKEYSFRKPIAGKNINYGNFCCKGIFYKRKIFLNKKKINEPWSTQFIKLCCRIVKSFTIDINDTVNKTTTEFLRRQLYFITKSIRTWNYNTNRNNI